jgi:hypothetical protein
MIIEHFVEISWCLSSYSRLHSLWIGLRYIMTANPLGTYSFYIFHNKFINSELKSLCITTRDFKLVSYHIGEKKKKKIIRTRHGKVLKQWIMLI